MQAGVRSSTRSGSPRPDIPGFERIESQGWDIVSPLSAQPLRDNALSMLGGLDLLTSPAFTGADLDTGEVPELVRQASGALESAEGGLAGSASPDVWGLLTGLAGLLTSGPLPAPMVRSFDQALRLSSQLISCSDLPQYLSCVHLAGGGLPGGAGGGTGVSAPPPAQQSSGRLNLAASLEALKSVGSQAKQLVSTIGTTIAGIGMAGGLSAGAMNDAVKACLVERVIRLTFRLSTQALVRGPDGLARQALHFLERRQVGGTLSLSRLGPAFLPPADSCLLWGGVGRGAVASAVALQ